TLNPCSPRRTFQPTSIALFEREETWCCPAHDFGRAKAKITLQPDYGRFVTAFCGTFWPSVADHGLTQGAAPRSNSARMRAESVEIALHRRAKARTVCSRGTLHLSGAACGVRLGAGGYSTPPCGQGGRGPARCRFLAAQGADKFVGGSDAVPVIDDTAIPKKGMHSLGV